GKNYKNIKEAIKTLADKSLWLLLDSGSEALIRWINKAWINKRSEIIKIRLDDDMKPYLLQLQHRFTQYELLYTLAMRSQYSIRLYELLKSYVYRFKNKDFDIDELKLLLSAENYNRYPDFKRYVLDTALREINDLSDIAIAYEPQKDGRRYAKIIFSMRVKKEYSERIQTWARIDEIINPAQISLFDKIGAAFLEGGKKS
ncbi:MAG: replication initiation protein, partial [Defluviitaleaceae bacterium]|nr:replication initiation protein [Defluviitaleaceae bacterium]